MDAKKTGIAAQALMSYLAGMLVRGELKPGDELPAIDEMSTKLDLSPSSVRDSLVLLSATGVVEAGKGYTRLPMKASDAMLKPLMIGLLLEQGTRQDLHELRTVIEISAIELGITKSDSDALQALADNLRKYEGRMNEGDKESLAELDRQYHQLILEMSANPLFIRIGIIISQLYALPLEKALAAWGPEQILSNHRILFEAIRDRDIERARGLVMRAFERSKEFY